MPWVTDANAALLTDLYELTMAASYHRHGMTHDATFDLFVRELPHHRNFLVAAGLEEALHYLEELSFDPESLDYLGSLEMFDRSFLDYLSTLRFTGDVWAMPEGTVAFAREPLLSVTAPLIEAQIVETFLLNAITFQTMVASKAARVEIAAGERSFLDFSLRRDHGADAGLKAARASFIGGAAATSNVLAGALFGLPVSGTMAHSYVMSFDSEVEAFRTFARDFPDRAVLLIDTFDVLRGAERAVQVAHELEPEGVKLRAVRIDSGNLGAVAHDVRKILDDAGLRDTQIVLSGDLDEYRVKDLIDAGVPVDSFGVGTQMGTSADAPSLGGVYKLVWDERSGPKVKLSTGKVTLPGRKQVHRFATEDGTFHHDVISLNKEEVEGSTPLLEKVMMAGKRTGDQEPLTAMQARCAASLRALPDHLLSLDQDANYVVGLSRDLQSLEREAALHFRA